MRCVTLAKALTRGGFKCCFVMNAGGQAFFESTQPDGLEVITFDDDTIIDPSFLQTHWPQGCALLVVDHYGLDADFEKACRPWAKRILVIDDLANRQHDCDLLLDQTLGRSHDDYATYVPADCRVMAGPRYALLRSQFALAREDALSRRQHNTGPARLLVNLGASDPDNMTRIALEGIALSDINADIDVVIGAGNNAIGTLRDFARSMPQDVTFYVNVQDMAGLMSRADLAIGAGGTTSWERCCLGLPTLLVTIAENQREVAETLAVAGAVTVLGDVSTITAETTAKNLRSFWNDQSVLRDMSDAAASICDGWGAQRLWCLLLAPGQAKDTKAVTLDIAALDNAETIYHWQCDPRTRQYARVAGVPTRDEHFAWVRQTTQNPDCTICMILHDGKAAGVLRFDLAAGDETLEVSILVAPEKYGLGIGQAALHLGRQLFPGKDLLAEVLPGNEASHKMFRRAGYQSLDDTHYLSRPHCSESI